MAISELFIKAFFYGLFISFAVISAIMLFWKLWFLRDPERKAPKGKSLIACPADGVVIAIVDLKESKIGKKSAGTRANRREKSISKKRKDSEKGHVKLMGQGKIIIRKGTLGKIYSTISGLKSPRYLISIFMSPLDVHVQRSPIEGTVKKIKHKKGRFIAANTLDALQNESNEIIISNKRVELKVIQIAGFLARRISCFVKENSKVEKGQRIGLINLGSQVTIILPDSCIPSVLPGQRVYAGETIIAKISGKS